MAPVVKDTRTGKYQVRFQHPVSGKRKTVNGGWLEKRTAEAFLRRLTPLCDAVRSSVPAGESERRWLRDLPERLTDRLRALRVLPPDLESALEHWSGHVDGWDRSRKAEGYRDKLGVSRVTEILEWAGITSISQLTGVILRTTLEEMREERGWVPSTTNAYLAKVKAFARWLASMDTPVQASVFAVRGFRVRETDTIPRRVLTAEECTALLSNCHELGERYGSTGLQRGLIYLVALSTGARLSELRSMQWDHFDFVARTLTFPAETSKSERTDTIPISDALAKMLEPIAEESGPVFPMAPQATRFAQMLRADLEALGYPAVTPKGIAVFHSLRHTYVTRLAEAGVAPPVLKALARHSKIQTTLDVYAHLDDEVLRAGIQRSPILPLPRTRPSTTRATSPTEPRRPISPSDAFEIGLLGESGSVIDLLPKPLIGSGLDQTEFDARTFLATLTPTQKTELIEALRSQGVAL